MIVAAMIGYYVFAIGLLALVGYLAGRRNIRDFTALTDQVIADMREKHGATAPLEPLPAPAALTLTVRRHPETDGRSLPVYVSLLVHKASEMEAALGGNGLILDQSESRETPLEMALRLKPRTPDGATQRLQILVDRLTEWRREAAGSVATEQDHDINRLAERELAALDFVAVRSGA